MIADTDTTASAREIQRMFGSNYYAATLLLPKTVREDIFIFYAFVRLADEIVDNPNNRQTIETEFDTFSTVWEEAYASGESNHAILKAFAEVCKRKNVPYHLTTDFLTAMSQDLSVSRYESYSDLKSYMYGSAVVIGHILTHLFDCQDDAAIPHATALGEAMQLTNFLRDIHEDATLRNRVYVPQEYLRKHNVTEEMLTDDTCNTAVQLLVKDLSEKAHTLFAYANDGICHLPRSVRPAVHVASALYEEILHELRRRDYCIQKEKIRFSKFKKFWIALVYGYVKTN